MTKQSFEQRLIIARIMNRHVAQHESTSLDRPVFAALEKWIEASPRRGRSRVRNTRLVASNR
ncbi:MAG TPA: hypothetical protein VMV68_03135 [Spirochaetia bacterium]|nr:hypothetical protein [Spirochaetia bacterium]